MAPFPPDRESGQSAIWNPQFPVGNRGYTVFPPWEMSQTRLFFAVAYEGDVEDRALECFYVKNVRSSITVDEDRGFVLPRHWIETSCQIFETQSDHPTGVFPHGQYGQSSDLYCLYSRSYYICT